MKGGKANIYSIYGQFNKSGFLANRMNKLFFFILKKNKILEECINTMKQSMVKCKKKKKKQRKIEKRHKSYKNT